MNWTLEKGLRAPYAWVAGWVAWFIAVTAWAFALPFLANAVAVDSQAISAALIAALFLVTLLALPILWLMLVMMQPSATHRIRVPLIAFALFIGVLLLVASVSSGDPSQSSGNSAIAVFFFAAISLFSLGAPAIALSMFLSDVFGSGQTAFVWKTIVFFCMLFVTVIPIWIASLTRHGRPAQRRLVIGLFLGYWAYVVLGLIAGVTLGLVTLWM